MKKKAMPRILIVTIITIFLILTNIINVFAYGSKTQDIDYLNTIMDMIVNTYKGDVSKDLLYEAAIRGMFYVVDPYTEFYSLSEAESFFSTTTGVFDGIGISMELAGSYVTVNQVFRDSPADKAGIKVGDRIVEINGKNVVGAGLNAVGDMIKGEKGTSVKVGIIRDGEKDVIRFTVTRETIKVNPVLYEIRGDIGYILIDMFNENAYENFKAALNEFDKKGIKKVILDLRDNPGGEVDQAVKIAQEIVPAGDICSIDFKPDFAENITYKSTLKATKYNLVCLINENSASASELLASAIQESKAGVLVGKTSYGKAKVQHVIPILTPSKSSMYKELFGKAYSNAFDVMYEHNALVDERDIMGWAKITTGEYFTRDGNFIDQKGIKPEYDIDGGYIYNGYDLSLLPKINDRRSYSLGNESTDIYNTKKIFKALGKNITSLDYIFDKELQDHISQFQEENGISKTAKLDRATIKEINSYIEKLILETDLQYSKALDLLK